MILARSFATARPLDGETRHPAARTDVIHFRHFLNTDPPYLESIWNQQAPLRGRLQQINGHLIEQLILSKPYFDSRGLIFAFRGPPMDDVLAPLEPLGFIHAGFAPAAGRNELDRTRGAIVQLQLVPGEFQQQVAEELVARAVEYLAQRGVKQICGGADFPHCPFYLGLYGGSELPGVLEKDRPFSEALERNGFSPAERILILQRTLADFRPIGGRDQIAIRRKYQINTVVDPTPQNWWECCIMGMAARERFSIYHKQQQTICGNVSFWDMQPLAGQFSSSARGMYALNVPEAFRRTGIATFLVGEALRYCMQQGVELVEAQTGEHETAAVGTFTKLGFSRVDAGRVYRRDL